MCSCASLQKNWARNNSVFYDIGDALLCVSTKPKPDSLQNLSGFNYDINLKKPS